jgi:thiamine kinase-like enzyme
MQDSDQLDPSLPAALQQALRSIPVLEGKRLVITPLEGGITNRNFRLDAGGESFVLRVAGQGTEQLGIDRRHESLCAQVAAACGAGCAVVASLPEHGAMVSRYAMGSPLAAGDTENTAVLARAVRTLLLFHGAQAVPGRFCPHATIDRYLEIARQHNVPVSSDVGELRDRLADLQSTPEEKLCPCHNDLLPANLIDDGQRVRIIDWEYAAMGDRFFDLGNLAENGQMSPAAESNLLALYFGATRAHDLGRLRTMRAVSAMREAAWGFAQAGLSSLNFDFLAYARRHFDAAVQRLRSISTASGEAPMEAPT